MSSETSIPETLARRLRERKVIPFVGAGLSMSVLRRNTSERLYPSWNELLKRAAERLEAEKKPSYANAVLSLLEIGLETGKSEHYLAAARHAHDGLGPNWYDFLREQFDHNREEVDDGSLELARLIWRLGSQIVVTTNYDKVLHWACPKLEDLLVWDVNSPAEQVSFLRGEMERPIVWHLHGHVGNLSGVILTPDGYSRLYLHDIRSDDPYRAALETLRFQLSSYSFLFVGFSFNDSHFSAQLRHVEDLFSGAAGPHYVLLSRSDANRMERNLRPRVEPLTYENHGPPLVDKLKELVSIRETGAPSTIPVVPPVASIPASPILAVRVPPFHCGSVVPLDFFIDREAELVKASEYIATRQSFLIIGNRRAGKTSFGQKLIHSVIANASSKGTRILGSYLDLQQYSALDIDRFLSHSLLNLIGEVARQVFECKYTTLSQSDPFKHHPQLQQDAAFKDLLELYREVVTRTHSRGGSTPSELRPDEFERFIADLIEITRLKGWHDLFIFYDEANRLPLDLSVEFLTWNVEALNRAGIVSIYASSPEMAEKFNPWSDREIHIGPFLTVDDLLCLLAKYYFGDMTRRNALPIAHDAVFRLWELSLGVPYLIQHLSGLSFSCANKEGVEQVEQRHVSLAYDQLFKKRPDMFKQL